jgi:hypothetical protein
MAVHIGESVRVGAGLEEDSRNLDRVLRRPLPKTFVTVRRDIV